MTIHSPLKRYIQLCVKKSLSNNMQKWPKTSFTICLSDSELKDLNKPIDSDIRQFIYIIRDWQHKDTLRELELKRVDPDFLSIKLSKNQQHFTLKIILKKMNNWYKKYILDNVDHSFLESIHIDTSLRIITTQWGS